MTNVLLAGAIYGVGRPLLANALPNLFNVGPVDSDNALIGGAGWYLSKKSGLMKAIGVVTMAGEAAQVTAKVTGGMTGSGAQTVSQGAFNW